jgi:MFS family permease
MAVMWKRRSDAAVAAEWRAGWPIVATGILGNGLGAMAVSSLGAFIAPLSAEFGWSRTELTSGTTGYTLIAALCFPLVGLMVDRWSPRRIAIPGAILTGVVFSAFATLNGSLAQWLIFWLLLAVANQLVTVTIWSAAVSRAFTASRGLALAITMTGNGLSVFASPLLANWLIESEGWRAAYLAMGSGWGLVVLLLAWGFIGDDGMAATVGRGAETTTSYQGLSVRDGLRSAAFAKIATVAALMNLIALAILINLIPILSLTGLPRQSAVLVTGTVGIWMIVVKFIIGFLLDHLPARLIGAGFALLLILACALFLAAGTSLFLQMAAAAIFGLAIGTATPIPAYLATRHFGLRAFGTLFGFMGSLIAIGSAIGPLLGAAIFDRTGNYDLLLLASMPLCLLCAGLYLSLGRYPSFDREAALATA